MFFSIKNLKKYFSLSTYRAQFILALCILGIFLASSTLLWAQRLSVPIKNITRVDGVRSNQLRGFGIVVGLAGTGDGQIGFVNRSIANALKELGIRIENPQEAQLDNIAAVMVTASLPPFKKSGDKIDVTLSSLGSADDLSGGVLVQTPLKAADGQVYAVAQGPVTKGGDAEDRHLTTVRIPGGGLVEREVPFEFVGRKHQMKLQLKNGDFTTANRIAETVNDRFEKQLAKAQNPTTVEMTIPQNFRNDPVSFISQVENIEINPAENSKVVVNERTGTVLMGGAVSVRPVSISHGDLTLQVQGDQEDEAQGESVVLPKSTTVQQIVDSLNEVGAATDSIIAILEAMDRANSLNAPLEVM